MQGESGGPKARVTALCGGVGGAKLAAGLARIVPSDRLTVVVNTGDDFHRYGLHVSPDVDTVLYTLSGRANRETGWGVAGDTSAVMDGLHELSAGVDHDPWFHLGDRDLATHLLRTAWLGEGESPTAVTRRLARGTGVSATVLPMTDDTGHVTTIRTADGDIPFQEWFVHRGCEPPAIGVRYGRDDADPAAAPTDAVLRALAEADLVVLCPSNPYLSIGPILSLRGVRKRLASAEAPVVAVSPIVGGRALKGPAAQMLREIHGEASSTAVAHMYRDFADGILIDTIDAAQADQIRSLGMAAAVASTVMTDDAARVRLAEETLRLGEELRA